MFSYMPMNVKYSLHVLILLSINSRVISFTPQRTIPSKEQINKNFRESPSRPETFELATSTVKDSIAIETTQLRRRRRRSIPQLTDSALVIPTDASNLQAVSKPNVVQDLPLLQLALAGSVATFLADLSIHPIDCIKTIQQSDQGVNWSMLDAARYLYKQDGVSGFFHGFLTYAVSDAAAGSLKFGVWETWKRQLKDVPGEPPIWFAVVGAALAFTASSVVVVPGEFLKQQLQMSHYGGFWEALQCTVFEEDGSFHLDRLFTGYDGVLFRDIPYTILELGLYDNFKRTMDKRFKARSTIAPTQARKSAEIQNLIPWDGIVCAAATGVVAAIATTPMDVIKTKLMVDNYASFLDCLMVTVEKNGLEILHTGMTARISWIVPFTVLYLPIYDFLKTLLLDRHIKHTQNLSTPSL